MAEFSEKLVAVLNKSVEPGRVMNALAHMCIGLGASIGPKPLHLIDYLDKGGGIHPNISKSPFMILRANSNKIAQLREKSIEEDILFTDFTETMTIGSWEEQLERTKETDPENLVYFGIVLFGPWDKVTEMTKKFSLWK